MVKRLMNSTMSPTSMRSAAFLSVFLKMALEIARLLNTGITDWDRDGINDLIAEYMHADGTSDTESELTDEPVESDEDGDMRENDFDEAMAAAANAPDIVLQDADQELDKATAFRYVDIVRV